MRDILVVCPQERDLTAIATAGLDRSYGVRYASSDLDALERFDAPALLAECLAGAADGVVGTKDRSALLAAIAAERRGLPGPRPGAVVACQHKPTARRIAAEAVPEATPRWALLDGGRPPFPPPFFVKPAVGRLSQGSRRVGDLGELARLDDADDYAEGYAALAALAGFDAARFRGYVAEELLEGREVTLEGFVHDGRATTVGVTDSLKYPGTNSFQAFAYPSALPAERLEELAGIAARLLPALGFQGGFFNVEFFVGDGPAQVIEVNARIASQFAPLVAATHGRSTYDALFALACGDDPRWDASRPDGAAVSYALRSFEDAFVEAVPDAADDLEVLVRPGLRLSEQEGANDVASYRLAILYAAAETREDALRRARERAERLSFRLRPAAAR